MSAVLASPRRHWSLGDMVENFPISAIRLIQAELSVLINISINNDDLVGRNGGYENVAKLNVPKYANALSDAVSNVRSLTEMADAMFFGFDCVHISHAIATLKWWLSYEDKKWSDLKSRAINLRDAIDNELKQYLYYQYPRAKGEKLRSWQSDWGTALTAFPSIDFDVLSAVDCFAMGHNTASVFHCMRILEHGLSALASDVGLNFDVQQWHTIIEQIESRITEQRKTLPKGEPKNERLQFLSEAAKEFFYFKDGWRNYVSHNRGKYDENQALSILEHTRSFMSHLASHLTEQA